MKTFLHYSIHIPGDLQKNDDKNEKNKKNKNRFDQLYEEGKQKMKLKRDRPKDEIDIEEQGNECTFTPDIYSLTQQKIPETKFANDIYNEKEYKYLYERLKHGRLERMVKDSNNDRYGLNNELIELYINWSDNKIIVIDINNEKMYSAFPYPNIW